MRTNWSKWERIDQNVYELTKWVLTDLRKILWVRISEKWVRVDQKRERIDLSTNWLEDELTSYRKICSSWSQSGITRLVEWCQTVIARDRLIPIFWVKLPCFDQLGIISGHQINFQNIRNGRHDLKWPEDIITVHRTTLGAELGRFTSA